MSFIGRATGPMRNSEGTTDNRPDGGGVEEARVLITDVIRELPLVSPRIVRLVLVLLVASGLWVAVARRWWSLTPAALALVVTSLVWLRVDQREEGDILFVLTATHGVTQADLAVPAVIGGALLIRAARALGSRRPR